MKHLHQNQEFRLNEILFEHRNKEYGAYVLRNESDRLLTKALFVGVGLLAAISITPVVISAFKTEVPVHIPTEGPPVIIKLKKVDHPETPPVKVEPVKPVTPPNVKTYDARTAEPKRDAVEDNKKDIPKDAVAEVKDNFKGEPVKGDVYVAATSTAGTGSVVTPVQPPVIDIPKDDNTIKTAVDVEANFEGGINSFRDKVMNKFDTSGFEDEGVVKTMVTFIVEKDGTISGLKADGKDVGFNNEALRTIRTIKGKWVPAKIKGQAVRSYFKFPISMKFE